MRPIRARRVFVGRLFRMQGYIVRYGIAGDKLYNNFQVMGENTLEIGSLNKGVAYYFTIDAYNENGITRTSRIKVCR